MTASARGFLLVLHARSRALFEYQKEKQSNVWVQASVALACEQALGRQFAMPPVFRGEMSAFFSG